jgi:protein-S-isoprenylcysteine O-methyltransferase Ste14
LVVGLIVSPNLTGWFAGIIEAVEGLVTMNGNATNEKAGRFPWRLYPPIWFLLFAVASLVLAWLWPLSLPFSDVIRPFSLLLAFGGGAIALWAALLFKRQGTPSHPYVEASQLVTLGPYRFTRNPMYLGLLLALVALGLWLQSLSALLLSPLFMAVIHYGNILPEERRLAAQFGQTYERYLTRTRRWL